MKKVPLLLMTMLMLLMFAVACAEEEFPALTGLKTELGEPSLSLHTEVTIPEKKESKWGFSPIIGGAETLIPAAASDSVYADKVELHLEKFTLLDDLKETISADKKDIRDSIFVLDLDHPNLNLEKPDLNLKDSE